MKGLYREVKPGNTDPSGSMSCSTWQEKCSRKKALFPDLFFLLLLHIIRAASSMFHKKMTHPTKKDGASLFSAVKRKHPFREIYIQVMAGGK